MQPQERAAMKTVTCFDQFAAAWLLCNGAVLVQVIPGKWFNYSFNDSAGEATRLLNEWRAGETLIQARDFTRAIKRIKTLTRDWPTMAGKKEVESGISVRT